MRLGYSFRDLGLLEQALTHASARDWGGGANDRLEFVGDAALGLSICAALYKRFPKATVGELTNFKSIYASNEHLAAIAQELDLGWFLRIGKGEERKGGRDHRRALANALEAVLGAAYLDGGIDAVNPLVERHVLSRRLEPEGRDGNSKSALQEWLQARGRDLPQYVVSSIAGPLDRRTYRVEARYGEHVTVGEGSRKKIAEREAARRLLACLLAAEGGAATTPAHAAGQPLVK